jgi:Cu+-exporting ATPase
MATDPVCGTKVEQSTAPAKAEFEGVTYYFCSAECAGEFEDDPEAYAESGAA